jgi:Domain of unknown function (DUF1902)
MKTHNILIQAEWDDEAKVYVASSDDVHGLVAEAAILLDLIAKLEILVPELLDLNAQHHQISKGDIIFLDILVRHVKTIYMS